MQTVATLAFSRFCNDGDSLFNGIAGRQAVQCFLLLYTTRPLIVCFHHLLRLLGNLRSSSS